MPEEEPDGKAIQYAVYQDKHLRLACRAQCARDRRQPRRARSAYEVPANAHGQMDPAIRLEIGGAAMSLLGRSLLLRAELREGSTLTSALLWLLSVVTIV